MSSSGSPRSEKLDTRFSTPAPELDDHRTQATMLVRSDLPQVEIQQPTPRRNTLDPAGLLQIDDALRGAGEMTPIARDFENAIADDERHEGEDAGVHGKHGSSKMRHSAHRQGRSHTIEKGDRSRDTSSSRSTSPANSVEAFAEPRRRVRANTAESRDPSVIEALRARTYSNVTGTRRPTLSNISPAKPSTQRAEEDYAVDDVGFTTTEEPGKTYKIDFEELEEFVALSAQGLISEEPTQRGCKSFHDRRCDTRKDNSDNIMLNCEHPVENGLGECFQYSSPSEFSEKGMMASATKNVPDRERFCLYASDDRSALFAAKLGDFTAKGDTFRDLFDVSDGGMWWLDVQTPTKAELDVIAKAFKIHRLTTEDIETQEPREKVELFNQYYFVCFRTFFADKMSEDFLDPVHIYIIVFSDGVISFSYSDNSHSANVRKRVGRAKDVMEVTPDYVCYAMIDDIVDSFAPIIRDAERESEGIEDQVFISRDDDHLALLRQIGECRKRVLNMMRLLGGKADVIKGFAKRCNEQYSVAPRGDIGLYLGDIQDHVVTMMSNLGHVEKMLSRSHGNYLAQLNVDNILKGNHTNKALTKITVLASIIVPLNLVTGLFGMNVPVPGRETTGLQWFFGIVGCLAAFICFCLFMARRFKAI